MIVRLALVLLALAAVPVGWASDTELSGGEGHLRARLPLTVSAESFGGAELDAAVRRAVDDWNSLAQDTLGVTVFSWGERREDAHVTIGVEAPGASRLMGVTYLQADAKGVIALPVRIVATEPAARGQTSRETLLYQVIGHELGHALGLGHASDPRSLMCCVSGSVNFEDPVARAAYIEARRHPDVRSVGPQLAAHYARFWRLP